MNRSNLYHLVAHSITVAIRPAAISKKQSPAASSYGKELVADSSID